MVDPEITFLDDKCKDIIEMMGRDSELAKLEWYQSEEFVPIDKETNELNEICGSVELGKEKPANLEHNENSGGMVRRYRIECRIAIWVPPQLRKSDTPTLNEFRQRIKKVWTDCEDQITDYPENIIEFEYLGSESLTLGVHVQNVEKTISKVLPFEGFVYYLQDGF
jgi:hypothetical protein